jgi:hypothetical protein
MSDNVYAYIKREMEMSLAGLPDTDFQRGYLAGLLVLAKDVLGLDMNEQPFSEAEKLCLGEHYRMHRLQSEIAWRSRELLELEELIGERS